VVPSHSENFGMTIAEALAHGVPVVASRGTPWSDLPARACGWWVENNPEALAGAIREASTADLQSMGEVGRDWMSNEFDWPSIAGRMHDTYKALASLV